ncbi:MAG: hypothetical protein H8E44_08420 [Planctomycetes bacterium]|nr:hypothetical protein [Planctomycetota bacterium]MBL7041521.1 hypothetical protein [Pirellulaceae bacterium]
MGTRVRHLLLTGFPGCGKLLLPDEANVKPQLQWGRDFSATESLVPLPLPFAVVIASMGPRLLSRGKRAVGG